MNTINFHKNVKTHLVGLLNNFRESYIPHSDTSQSMVHPCVIQGRPTLVFERGLHLDEADVFELLVEFANHNGFEVQEDRREEFVEGIKRVKDKHTANAISIIFITASLLSPRVFAESKYENNCLNKSEDMSITIKYERHDELSYLLSEIQSVKTENELLNVLLVWINCNSSFDYRLNEMPRIKKVNEIQMKSLASGNELPASVVPITLRIKGLYNFHSKTIYLLDSFSINNEEDRAILLHEVVHFLQFQYGDDNFFDCKQKLESFAYRLQAKYLYHKNQKIDITGQHIRQASRCH